METYETIKKYLNDNKQDNTFAPKLLEELSPSEKVASEYEIAMLCRKGCQQYYKFIPYLKTIDIEKVLTPEFIESLSPTDKMEIIKNLFIKTKSPSFLSELTTSSLESPIAFNNLINLSNDDRLSPDEQDKIKEIVAKVYEKKESDINYRIIAEYKLSEKSEKPYTK